MTSNNDTESKLIVIHDSVSDTYSQKTKCTDCFQCQMCSKTRCRRCLEGKVSGKVSELKSDFTYKEYLEWKKQKK